MEAGRELYKARRELEKRGRKGDLSGFIQTPLTDFFRQQDLFLAQQGVGESGLNIAFAYMKQNNLTDLFMFDLWYRLAPIREGEKRVLRNIVIDIKSEFGTGTGKSTAGAILYYNIHRINGCEFTERHISFSLASIQDMMKDAKIGDTFMLDETRKTESLGIGSVYYLDRLNDIINVSRARSLNFIAIGIPQMMGGFNYHYRLLAESINLETEENLMLVQDSKGRFRGHIFLKKPKSPVFDSIYRKYQKKKDEFIINHNTGDMKVRASLREKYARMLIENEDFVYARNKNERLLIAMETIGDEISTSEMNLIITKAVIMMRKMGIYKETRGRKKSD